MRRPSTNRIKLTGESIRLAIREFRRDPMQEFLAIVLDEMPTPEAIRNLAERNPYLWTKIYQIAMMGAGYAVREETDVKVFDYARVIDHLSMDEVNLELARLRTGNVLPDLPDLRGEGADPGREDDGAAYLLRAEDCRDEEEP